MKKKMKAVSLTSTHSGASATGPGPCQPPRKNVTASAETTIMFMYSAMKNEPKRMPPNSVLKPPTISASASGRSNGGRLVSAKPATRKIRKPTNCGTMYHMSLCDSTIWTSDSEPAVMITPSSDSPSATSYEISCAAARIAPRNEYFEPDAQPPSMRP